MQIKITNKLIPTIAPKATPYEIHDTEIKGFLLRIQPSGVMSYYFSYYNPSGKRQRIRIGKVGTLSALQAREAAERHAGHVALGKDVHLEKKIGVQAANIEKTKTLRNFIESRYRSWAQSHLRTTKGNLDSIYNHFADLLDKPMDEITTWHIEKWRAAQLKKERKRTSLNRNVACLKAVLSKAVAWEVIDHHPLAKVKPLKIDDNKITRFLSREEEQRLRAALMARRESKVEKRISANQWRIARDMSTLPELVVSDPVDHIEPMVLLSLNTGLRKGELLSLTWDDISMKQRTLHVRGEIAKSRKGRFIPLNDEALQLLKSWKASQETNGHGDLVFYGKSGAQLTTIKTAWAKLLADAKIIEFRWHDLRHTFASNLVMNGVDLNTVRELLGHASIDMTLRYAHLSPEHKAEAVQRLMARVS